MRNEKGQFVKGHGRSNTGRTLFKKGSSGFTGRHSVESKKKMSQAHKGRGNYEVLRKFWSIHPRPKGPEHYSWTGGKTSENKRIRRSREFADWRKKVFERDNYTCQDCFKRGGTLHPDHIKPFSLFPELRFEVTNGRTLCKECHLKTPTWGGNCKGKKREDFENHV